MKKKMYTSLGLMSGTSMDGLDLSVIKFLSDCLFTVCPLRELTTCATDFYPREVWTSYLTARSESSYGNPLSMTCPRVFPPSKVSLA